MGNRTLSKSHLIPLKLWNNKFEHFHVLSKNLVKHLNTFSAFFSTPKKTFSWTKISIIWAKCSLEKWRKVCVCAVAFGPSTKSKDAKSLSLSLSHSLSLFLFLSHSLSFFLSLPFSSRFSPHFLPFFISLIRKHFLHLKDSKGPKHENIITFHPTGTSIDVLNPDKGNRKEVNISDSFSFALWHLTTYFNRRLIWIEFSPLSRGCHRVRCTNISHVTPSKTSWSTSTISFHCVIWFRLSLSFTSRFFFVLLS